MVEAALAYFETNAERMRYATFRAAGHFVRSGTVESGCKAVIGPRLKLSGVAGLAGRRPVAVLVA